VTLSAQSGISLAAAGKWLYAVLLAATLFGFPIVSVLPVVLHTAPRPISVAYRVAICVLSLASLWIGIRLKRPLIDRAVLWSIGSLAFLLLFRMFWDSNITRLPIDLPWDVYWLQVLGTTFIPALAFLVVPEYSWIIRAHRLSLWFGLAAAASIIVGAVLSFRTISHGGRLITDVLNPISIGAAGVSMYIVAATHEKARNWLIRFVKGLVILLGVATCILSASKAPLLAFALVILVQFWFFGGKVSIGRRVLLVLIPTVAIAAGVAVSLWISQSEELTIVSRFTTAGSDESTLERLLLWRGALAQFNASPLLGESFVEAITRGYPHNDILEAMMATGIVGLLLLLFLLLVGLISTLHQLKKNEFRWLGILFLQILAGEQTSGSLYFSQIFWTMLLIVIAVARVPAFDANLRAKSAVT
jgi:O-antigen ligase